MPKITYIKEEPQPKYKGVKTGAGKFVVLFLFLSFVMGITGGVGSLLVFSSSPILKDKLGIDLQNLNLTQTTTQKIVLEESSTIIDASKKVSPAVVSITASQENMDFFGRIYKSQSAGTGFIITNDGYIVTNRHVGSDINAAYSIFTSDGKKFDGKVVAQDPLSDIAIIKIDAKGLPVVDLGDSDQVIVGQWVIAIGNALGELQNTVTVGIVSARERQVSAGDSSTGQSESLENLIQTDAAINSGNSGGPLVNLAGQVIGVNTAVAGNAQGIGFAIPINTVKSAINSFLKNNKIIRPLLGVRYMSITSDIQQSRNLPVDTGALLFASSNLPAVVPGGPGDKAGLKSGDIITAINGDKITKTLSLGTLIQKYSPDDKIEITYLRDKKESKTTATLSSTD